MPLVKTKAGFLNTDHVVKMDDMPNGETCVLMSNGETYFISDGDAGALWSESKQTITAPTGFKLSTRTAA